MIQLSANYNYFNPNFVIQNLDEPQNWAHPIFAVLKNILMRGCPTIPSLYLRKHFGTPQKEKSFIYNRDFNHLDWHGVIRGGATSNPALDFYYNILIKHFPLGGSFIPEYPVSSILSDLDWLENSEQFGEVDFYSPVYNAIIEIDGAQHNFGEQKAKDRLRDELFARHNIKLFRIPTSILHNVGKVKEKLNAIFNGEGYRLKFSTPEPCDISNYVSYATAIRLQCLLLYLYGTGKIGLTETKFDLNIKADFDISEQTLQVILDDFFLWVKNLAGLQSLTFVEPRITLTLCKDNQTLLQQNGIKADISLTKVYCAAESDNVYYIRNDFFEYETYSQKRIKGQYCNLKGKNYYQVAYSPIEYNITAEQQGDYL